MSYIGVQMAFPVFHEFDADGTIRTNRLHWEGFPRLAWEALSAAGYLTPPTYEVSEFEHYGVPRCRVIVTVLPHPDHANWFNTRFIYWGFITHEAVESAALRVLTDFCDHNPTVVALSPFRLFPAVSPHNPAWLDRMDHLQELLTLLTPKFGKESDLWVQFEKESVWWKEGHFQTFSAKRSVVGYLLRFGKGTVELILRDWTVTWLNQGRRMDG
jgi:hypothetical protein